MDESWVAIRTDTPCIRCGECCKLLPCGLGELTPDGQCEHLTPSGCKLVEEDAEAREELLVGYGCGATFIPRVFAKRKDIMHEAMLFDPGDQVRYIGENPIKVTLPINCANVKGRIGDTDYSNAAVEFEFTILPNTSGRVTTHPVNDKHASVQFSMAMVKVTVQIANEDLEIVG